MREQPDALLRLLSLCRRRGWTPTALTWTTYGEVAEAAILVDAPTTRRTAIDLVAQIRRLIDVVDVVCDADAGVPDDIALAALRHRAPWRCGAVEGPVTVGG
jgi:acetolactate synthase regulatory subunit